MSKVLVLVFLASLILAIPAASAQDMATRISAQTGMPGLRKTQRAVPFMKHGLTFGYGLDFTKSSDLILSSDTVERHAQTLSLTYAPHARFALGLHHRIVTTKNALEAVQLIGDPALEARYNFPLLTNLTVGAGSSLMFPTSSTNSSIAFDSPRFDISGTATYRPRTWLEASTTLGYRLDRTLGSAPATVNATRRFGFGWSDSQQFTYAMGLTGIWDAHRYVGVAPFVELSGALTNRGSMSRQPVIASVGLNTLLLPSRQLEVGIGTDVGLNGAPGSSNPLSGVAKWDLFFRITMHMSAAPTPIVPTQTKTVIQEKIKEIVRSPDTFKIHGKIVSTDTKKPIPGAVIDIAGEATHISPDPATGEFTTWALTIGEGLYQIKTTAGGYLMNEITVAPGKKDEIKEIVIALQPVTGRQGGIMKGSLKNAETGATLAGTVFIPSLEKQIPTDANGQFQFNVPIGNYPVLITSPGYITQKKEIQVRHGDVIIINIDLTQKP